jgi:hypothetical protein
MKRRDRQPFGPLPEGDDAPAKCKQLGTHSRMAVVLHCMDWALMKETSESGTWVYMICYHAAQVCQETCSAVQDKKSCALFIGCYGC